VSNRHNLTHYYSLVMTCMCILYRSYFKYVCIRQKSFNFVEGGGSIPSNSQPISPYSGQFLPFGFGAALAAEEESAAAHTHEGEAESSQ